MCREQQQQLVHGILVLRKKKKKNSREKAGVSERLFHMCCKRLSLSLSENTPKKVWIYLSGKTLSSF
jgi:hypothetical protein